MFDAKNSETLAEEKIFKDKYNKELKHFIKLEEQRRAQDQERRYKERIGCKNEWDDALRTKQLEQKVQSDIKKIVAGIQNSNSVEELVKLGQKNERTPQEQLELNRLLRRNIRKANRREKLLTGGNGEAAKANPNLGDT